MRSITELEEENKRLTEQLTRLSDACAFADQELHDARIALTVVGDTVREALRAVRKKKHLELVDILCKASIGS